MNEYLVIVYRDAAARKNPGVEYMDTIEAMSVDDAIDEFCSRHIGVVTMREETDGEEADDSNDTP